MTIPEAHRLVFILRTGRRFTAAVLPLGGQDGCCPTAG